jgi:hypothetical protein
MAPLRNAGAIPKEAVLVVESQENVDNVTSVLVEDMDPTDSNANERKEEAPIYEIPAEYQPWESIGFPDTPPHLKEQLDNLVEQILGYATDEGRHAFDEASPKSGVRRFTSSSVGDFTYSMGLGQVQVYQLFEIYIYTLSCHT